MLMAVRHLNYGSYRVGIFGFGIYGPAYAGKLYILRLGFAPSFPKSEFH